MKTYQGTVDQNFITKSRKTVKWPRMCSKMAEGEDDFRKYYQMPNKMLVFLDLAGGMVGKNLPTNLGDSLIPGPGRLRMQRMTGPLRQTTEPTLQGVWAKSAEAHVP